MCSDHVSQQDVEDVAVGVGIVDREADSVIEVVDVAVTDVVCYRDLFEPASVAEKATDCVLGDESVIRTVHVGMNNSVSDQVSDQATRACVSEQEVPDVVVGKVDGQTEGFSEFKRCQYLCGV